MKTTLTMLIHGSSGVGKSWLAATAPGPRLVLDAEGRAKYAPSALPKIGWDPRVGPPPAADGSWDTCVVPIADFETLTTAYQWLRAGQHQFTSIVIDSLMEAQKRCVDAVVGVNALDQQDWGTLLRKVEALVRTYRDLTLIESNPACVVIFVCGTRTGAKSGKQEPLLQGQFADTVPYYMDAVGYYFKQPVADAAGNTSYVRSLLVDEIPGFVAKDGTGLLPGPVIQADPALGRPNIAALYELLKTQGAPAAPVTA